jgi:hypothetical protein
VSTSIEHNDGGANCFISNNLDHFVNIFKTPLQVKQLDGSPTPAIGYGLKLIQCPTTKIIIPLWPCYYMPDNPTCTFSPTALKHYLQYPTVVTNHLESLLIVTSNGTRLTFPSIVTHVRGQLLDYHSFNVVRPKILHNRMLPPATANYSRGTSLLTRELVHQCLAHSCDDTLDKMCLEQTMIGLPPRPFPKRPCQCPICALATLTCPPRGKFFDTSLLCRGQLLHLDFSFWDKVSLRGFTSVLSIIDAKTRMLWVFCTATKRPPLAVFDYFLHMLH